MFDKAVYSLYPEVVKVFNNIPYDKDNNIVDIDKDLVATKMETLKAKRDRLKELREQKRKGKPYKDIWKPISFTKDDAIGVLQVKAAFELGLAETIIEFSNGTKLPIKAEEFEDFAKWFVKERNKFFIDNTI